MVRVCAYVCVFTFVCVCIYLVYMCIYLEYVCVYLSSVCVCMCTYVRVLI